MLRLCCIIVVLLGTTAVRAQQDVSDEGPADYFFVVSEPEPGLATQTVTAQLYFFNYPQTVAFADIGFSWSNQKARLEWVQWPDLTMAVFDYYRLCFYKNRLDSSNYYRRFCLRAGHLTYWGLEGEREPRLIATYRFRLENWTVDDTLCISTDPWLQAKLTDRYGVQYVPVWSGPFGPLCGSFICGDVDDDGELNGDDITLLSNYYFSVVPPPGYAYEKADMDCDGLLTIADIAILAGYLWAGGQTPCCAIPLPPPEVMEQGTDGRAN